MEPTSYAKAAATLNAEPFLQPLPAWLLMFYALANPSGNKLFGTQAFYNDYRYYEMEYMVV